MKADREIELWKMLVAVAVAALALAAGAVMIQASDPGGSLKGISLPDASPAANVSSNVTNPAYSEINMQIYAADPGLQLYITAMPDTVTPMLTQFSATLRAPGNSSYYVTDNALHGPSDILSQGTFYYETQVSLSGSGSGTANFTFHVTSGTLGHTSNFSYLFQFMSPTTYINYEHAKIAPTGTYTLVELGGGIIGGISLGMAMFRVFLPINRRKIRKDNRKEGMILLASN